MEKVESQLPSRPRDEGSYEVSILDRPCYACRRLRVVCIGAGISGLTLAYHVSHDTGVSEFVDLAIYEKNAGIGGTWYENRYPGVAVRLHTRPCQDPTLNSTNHSVIYPRIFTHSLSSRIPTGAHFMPLVPKFWHTLKTLPANTVSMTT